jgi:hypothetical protein
MEPIKAPKTIKVYMLLKQTGLSFIPTGTAAAGMSTGFYPTIDLAEQNRTLSILADTSSGTKPIYHVYELDIPNPAYQE